MKIFSLLLTTFCFSCFYFVQAQDILPSQYYAAPSYNNPAFAGSGEFIMLNNGFRNQWARLPGKFITYVASADANFEKYNSGVGVFFSSEREGTAGLSNNMAGLQYAYHLNLTEQFKLRVGGEVSYVNRSIDFENLVYGDELITGQVSSSPKGNLSDGYLNVGFGAVFHGVDWWAGGSVHNVTEPRFRLLDFNDQSSLERRFGLIAGYRYTISQRISTTSFRGFRQTDHDQSIRGMVNYFRQGSFNLMNISAYYIYSPVVVGLSYRGIVDGANASQRGDAIVPMIGLTLYKSLNLIYSHDINFSTNSSGYTLGYLSSQELTLSYIIGPVQERRGSPKYQKSKALLQRFSKMMGNNKRNTFEKPNPWTLF